MPESSSPLTREFLEWISSRPRTYAETMEAWRTMCPRHSVWEDASIDGLIQVESDGINPLKVTLTERGKELLARQKLTTPSGAN